MNMRKSLAAVGAALAMTTAALGIATPASASSARDGYCDSGEFCYYYGWSQTGSVSDFTSSVPNYGTTHPSCYEFKGSGAGQYECIKNNARSVWNRSQYPVVVYYNSNYGGAQQLVAPGEKADLNSSMWFDNASHYFIS